MSFYTQTRGGSLGGGLLLLFTLFSIVLLESLLQRCCNLLLGDSKYRLFFALKNWLFKATKCTLKNVVFCKTFAILLQRADDQAGFARQVPAEVLSVAIGFLWNAMFPAGGDVGVAIRQLS